METIELKSESELLLLVDNKNELYDYIDKIHNILLDYQLIIDTVSYTVRGNVEKVELKKDFETN